MCINYRVQVPNAPLQSEALAKSKGVHREVESERSWRQKFEPTNRNCIEGVDNMGDVAFETKARYCTDKICVDAGVT